MVGCLFVLVGWLVGQLFYWLVDYINATAGRLVGWTVGQLVGMLGAWFIRSFICLCMVLNILLPLWVLNKYSLVL